MKESDTGLFYSWGNTQGVNASDAAAVASMTEAAYAGTSGAGLSADIPATADNDAAVAALGGNGRMPTKANFEELSENCDWIWKQLNGIYGFEIKSKSPGNTNSIFLPTAGYIDDGELIEGDSQSFYWSASEEDERYSFVLEFNEDEVITENSRFRYYGCPVRAVK